MPEFRNKLKRKEDLNKILESLDISPTMYRNAIGKYEALGKYFEDNELKFEMYPQGSFATGTITRPYRNGADKDYDLDFIFKIKVAKGNTSPKDIKNTVGDLLKNHGTYSKLLKEWDKCWTLEFAEINGVGFNTDIIPAAGDETLESPYNLDSMSVAITDKVAHDTYKWIKSNPKGYAEWFNRLNEPFLSYNSNAEAILESCRDFYNSVEEIPKPLKRSSLQRVIQILKRHRDLYFNISQKERYKPISAILTTITAQIADNLTNKNLTTFELLEIIVKDFLIYSEREVLLENLFDARYKNKKVIKKSHTGKWEILNPVNSEDNLADQWNENPKKAEYFFQWVKVLQKDLLTILNKEGEEFINILESSLGSNLVNSVIDISKYKKKKTQEDIQPSKPWRK